MFHRIQKRKLLISGLPIFLLSMVVGGSAVAASSQNQGSGVGTPKTWDLRNQTRPLSPQNAPTEKSQAHSSASTRPPKSVSLKTRSNKRSVSKRKLRGGSFKPYQVTREGFAGGASHRGRTVIPPKNYVPIRFVKTPKSTAPKRNSEQATGRNPHPKIHVSTSKKATVKRVVTPTLPKGAPEAESVEDPTAGGWATLGASQAGANPNTVSRGTIRLRRLDDEASAAAPLRAYGQRGVILTSPICGCQGGTCRATSLFGDRMHPILKVRKHHNGLDIGAPMGFPVRASAPGRVQLILENNPTAGNMVEIRHATPLLNTSGSVFAQKGFSTRYLHLQKILVQPGETVTAGQVIGTVGSTGRSTGPHLHYEIRANGSVVDPLTFVNGSSRDSKKASVNMTLGASCPAGSRSQRAKKVATER